MTDSKTTKLSLERKRDIIARALTFLDEAANMGVEFSRLGESHDPAIILLDMTNALGMDDWTPARDAFVRQVR